MKKADNKTTQQRYREAAVSAGLCRNSKQHGPATRGQTCEDCYQQRRKTDKARSPESFVALPLCDRHMRENAANSRVNNNRKWCADCLRLRRENGREKYQPIDEVLGSIPMQLMRALKRFGDWVTSAELLDAIGVCDSRPGNSRLVRRQSTIRNNYSAVLSRLTRTGMIERREPPKYGRNYGLDRWCEYRLSESGLQILALQLAQPLPVADREEADLDAVRRVFANEPLARAA